MAEQVHHVQIDIEIDTNKRTDGIRLSCNSVSEAIEEISKWCKDHGWIDEDSRSDIVGFRDGSPIRRHPDSTSGPALAGGLTDTEREALDYVVFATDCDFTDVQQQVERIKADAIRQARADLAAKVEALEAKLEEARVVAARPWVTLGEVRDVLAADSTPQEDPSKAHILIGSIIAKRCSACGSEEPHHLAYVVEHGVCVV